jgi:hypothetical protein
MLGLERERLGMAGNLPGSGRYQPLKKYSRSRVLTMSAHLRTEPLYVYLAPKIHKAVQASADANYTSPSRTITFIIESHEELLRLTMSNALRDASANLRSPEALDSSLREDIPAREFLALVSECRAHRFSIDRRRHFMISQYSKRLLGEVAGHHALDVIDIVEALLILCLAEQDIE